MKAFVMYDISKRGKIKNVMVVNDGSDRPEKIYEDRVDEYGDIRDKWMPYQNFIAKYGEDLIPVLKRLNANKYVCIYE
jgi:hypothetical protein